MGDTKLNMCKALRDSDIGIVFRSYIALHCLGHVGMIWNP